MDETPNYGFYKNPRFSANHLAEYLCTRDAGQREGVIRKAKFPRKPNVIAYQQVTPSIRSFLVSNTGNLRHFDELSERLAEKARREDGYNRDEALRCSAAIESFKNTYEKLKMGKAIFSPGPQDALLRVSGVSVNVRLDPPIIERGHDEKIFSGGCVMFMANSPEARKNIEDRRKFVAAIAHWALEEGISNVESLPRLCMSFDVFGREVTRAPTAIDRLRKTMTVACREAFNSWGDVEPPAGYDGPSWR